MSFQQLKILFVITSLRTGGAEGLLVELAVRLKNKGHIIDIFVFDGTDTFLKKELIKEEITVYAGGYGYLQMWNPFHLSKLNHLIIRNHYDVIHTNNTPAQILGALINSDNKIKLITTEHNTFNRRRKWFGCKIIDAKIYSRYDKVICVSREVESKLLKYLRYSLRDKFYVIYNGIDLSKFKNIIVPSVKKDKIIITMIAGFRKQKDHKTIIKAMLNLPGKYELWLAGEGKTKNKYERFVDELGLKGRVKFLGNVTNIPEVLSNSDIIVLSSHYEGMPISLIEAMAAGKPCIASDVDGNREIIKGYGLLFNYKDAMDLTLRIKTVNENRELCNQLSNLSLKRSQDFDIDKTVEQYEKLYLSCVK
ncbi:MAG: glycosyltransferase [Muribaculaceae bacterium]|nr:glycosyltransferase [Muribaculaceae bacterium]